LVFRGGPKGTAFRGLLPFLIQSHPKLPMLHDHVLDTHPWRRTNVSALVSIQRQKWLHQGSDSDLSLKASQAK
jgi:hypothetical protein